MRKIFCGTSGTDKTIQTHRLSEIPCDSNILGALGDFYGSDLQLRPAQDKTLFEYALMQLERNAIIATPTNSGKSMLAYLLLLQVALERKKAVLIEPLRALAYEKSEELKKITEFFYKRTGHKVKITITTGDYRLNDEFMNTRPDADKGKRGEIIIATPERLDAISRVKENLNWFQNISLLCVDEAHLLGDASRGAALELLIAFFRTLPTAPQIVLMSATIANAKELAEWLAPCKVIDDIPRYPKLDKWLYCLEDTEDANTAIAAEVDDILQDESTAVIIFVYRTESAESLAHTLAERLGEQKISKHDLSKVMGCGVAWFHSNMSAGSKEAVITAMTESKVRVVVSTTALSMGINLPATHVIVRDINFVGHKDLDISDLMQMLGRAGRGESDGTGIVILQHSSQGNLLTLENGLRHETLPAIQSRLLPVLDENRYGRRQDDLFYINRVGNQLLGILHRMAPVTMTSLLRYLENTLGGKAFSNMNELLQILIRWKLTYLNEDTNEYELTHLGRTASQCYLPPLTAANIGQLIRDLLQDNPTGEHIAQFAPIDFILALCLVSAETKPLARYSKGMERKISGYMEALPFAEKSYLYRTWIAASPDILFGSVHIDAPDVDARKSVVQATYTAMLIYDLSRGLSLSQLNAYYGLNVEEIEEKLRDNVLWLLYGLEKVMRVRSFYYHLKSNCDAEYEQIHAVEQTFKRASSHIFALVANLKYRSPLGVLVRGIKSVYPQAKSHPGEGTISKLQSGGISSIKDLVGKTVADLTALGVSRQYAELITGYIRKRLS